MADKNKDVEISSKVIKTVEGQIRDLSNFLNEHEYSIKQNGDLRFKHTTTGAPRILLGFTSALHPNNNKKYDTVATQFKFEQLEDGMKKISGLFKKFDTRPENIETADFTDGKHFEAIIDEFEKIVTTSIEGAKKNTKILDVDQNGKIIKQDGKIVTKYDSATKKF